MLTQLSSGDITKVEALNREIIASHQALKILNDQRSLGLVTGITTLSAGVGMSEIRLYGEEVQQLANLVTKILRERGEKARMALAAFGIEIKPDES